MSTQTQAPETSAPQILPSFVRGQWWRPDDPQKVTDVKDAATGELVARVSTDGLDTAGAVEYARTVGQASLGQLRIHDRALILKQLAQHLGEHKGQLYELSYATGSTAKDHLIDVDGGIGTLFTFSSKGRRELPNANVIVDGAVEQLSRDGSFLGEHVYTRLPGVAVQINAFNFPVWGMLEKFAPAFIAGVPTIVKPATPTGYVTEACVRLMLDSGLLPEGSLQLVSGSAGDLLDHLDGDHAHGERRIRDVEHAYTAEGGLCVLQGNLAEDGAVLKTAGISEDLWHFQGPARVVESQEEAVQVILSKTIQAGEVLVVRYEGPSGGPGMQEMLHPTAFMKGTGMGKKCGLITDGRFSGGSSGLSVGHISPEAAAGGVIGLIEDGDPILIDVKTRALKVLVDDDVLAERRAKMEASERPWQPKDRQRTVTTALRAYAKLATSADKGAVRRVD